MSKVKKLIKFCNKNSIDIDIWFHDKDDHQRTIELNATLQKKGHEIEFFMSYDHEWNLSRYEYKFEDEWFKFKDLETILDNIWIKTAQEKKIWEK